MHRLTARLLLLIVALGISQPLLEAFSAEPPHACCLRRLHGSANNTPHFQAAKQADGSCCPPLTTPHIAQVQSDETSIPLPQHSERVPAATNVRILQEFDSHNSSRAPPVSSRT